MNKFLSVCVIVFAIFFIPVFTIMAQEPDFQETKEATPTYTLPYPGILADNPLYKIKLLRDKIWFSLVQDQDEKAKLYLLFADKKIAMALALAQKGNYSLAQETALKGENELTQLTFFYKIGAVKPDEAFYNTLLRASKKHQETFAEIQSIVPENEKEIYTTLKNFSLRNEEEFGLIGHQE